MPRGNTTTPWRKKKINNRQPIAYRTTYKYSIIIYFRVHHKKTRLFVSYPYAVL